MGPRVDSVGSGCLGLSNINPFWDVRGRSGKQMQSGCRGPESWATQQATEGEALRTGLIPPRVNGVAGRKPGSGLGAKLATLQVMSSGLFPGELGKEERGAGSPLAHEFFQQPVD
jgi:hypothetical protein